VAAGEGIEAVLPCRDAEDAERTQRKAKAKTKHKGENAEGAGKETGLTQLGVARG
jgi:hypothetical protein